tara:strand:- start:974 stop:1900 length:927 start_codon:yes stop_codon:yes gene_type:complete
MAGINRSVRNLMVAAAVVTGFAFAPLTQAAEGPDTLSKAEAFVLSTSEQAVSMLDTGDRGNAELKQLFRNRFDHELMGRFALGGYWQKADAVQQSEYRSLFADYVPNNSMEQLKGYRGASIVVISSRLVEDGDSMVMTSVAPQNGEKVVFGWRIRAYQQGYKIIDIVSGGASYLTTLRQQFTAIASRNGIDGLLELLRKQSAAQAADAGGEFDDLAANLRATAAISPMSKLDLKRRTDALVSEISLYHDGARQYDISRLKSQFDALIQHVVTLLQLGDPSLAAAIEGQRNALWSSLSDPEQFAVVAMR